MPRDDGMMTGDDAHLDAVAHHEVLDAHRVALTDAVDAVDGLLLDGGVPPRVEQVDRLCGDQVEAHAACSSSDNDETSNTRHKGPQARVRLGIV